MRRRGLADAVKATLPESHRLVQFILSKVEERDKFAVAEAVKGVSLNAIEFYLSTPTGALEWFYKDTGLTP